MKKAEGLKIRLKAEGKDIHHRGHREHRGKRREKSHILCPQCSL
jgi:hypothetical protein